jgi:D-alanyl-D-alanine dipeptidase
MRYATSNNFVGEAVYPDDLCLLRPEALHCLEKAIDLARAQGFRLKILDAYRPQSAQEKLWSICPDPNYLAPPQSGSHHTRGVAVDLTLVDENGAELDMGTEFDTFTPLSHHGAAEISSQAAKNRYLLLGIMMSAGWDLYVNEWWHYQLFNPRSYDLILNHP